MQRNVQGFCTNTGTKLNVNSKRICVRYFQKGNEETMFLAHKSVGSLKFISLKDEVIVHGNFSQRLLFLL